jgi:hypothetical protein
MGCHNQFTCFVWKLNDVSCIFQGEKKKKNIEQLSKREYVTNDKVFSKTERKKKLWLYLKNDAEHSDKSAIP